MMLLNIASAVIVGGFIVLVVAGHVLLWQAIYGSRRAQPPRPTKARADTRPSVERAYRAER
jgi:hypothetical protein